jgi:hypothetical protein
MLLISEHNVKLLFSECLCYKDGDAGKSFCLQFFVTESVTIEISESSKRIVHLMVNTISPILLDTIIKGKTRINIHTLLKKSR